MKQTRFTSGNNHYDDHFPRLLREELCTTADDIKNLASKLGCSTQAINQYRNGIAYPKTENLIKIAHIYNRSLDNLIGLSDVKTPNAEVQAICKYTGLSESAVALLHYLSESTFEESKRNISFINTVLSDSRFSSHNDNFPTETVFCLLDQYIKAKDVKRSVPEPSEFPTSIEEFNSQNERHQFEENTVTVQSSEDLTEVVSISEIYRAYKWKQITKAIDYYMEGEKDNG